MVDSKTCIDCLNLKSLDEFHLASRAKPHLRRGYCKDCATKRHMIWRQKNPDKAQAAWRKASNKYYNPSRVREKLYGITEEEYQALLLEQDGKCAICLQKSDRALCVDHDHGDGTIRGLLCSGCNVSLGTMKDDPLRLRRAAEYLERSTLRSP